MAEFETMMMALHQLTNLLHQYGKETSDELKEEIGALLEKLHGLSLARSDSIRRDIQRVSEEIMLFVKKPEKELPPKLLNQLHLLINECREL